MHSHCQRCPLQSPSGMFKVTISSPDTPVPKMEPSMQTILRWAVLGSFLKIQLWAQVNLLHHPSWNWVRRLGEPEMIIVLWDKLWPKHFQIKEGLAKGHEDRMKEKLYAGGSKIWRAPVEVEPTYTLVFTSQVVSKTSEPSTELLVLIPKTNPIYMFQRLYNYRWKLTWVTKNTPRCWG